jgi:hypothetical protein
MEWSLSISRNTLIFQGYTGVSMHVAGWTYPDRDTNAYTAHTPPQPSQSPLCEDSLYTQEA